MNLSIKNKKIPGISTIPGIVICGKREVGNLFCIIEKY